LKKERKEKEDESIQAKPIGILARETRQLNGLPLCTSVLSLNSTQTTFTYHSGYEIRARKGIRQRKLNNTYLGQTTF